ncbi:peptidoglycan-binding protein [Petrachloros mirabilis]
MKEKRQSSPWPLATVLTIPLLSLGGCDYWPPALQTEIDTLRTELNDVLDERQRLEFENEELKSTREGLQRDVEEKARENATLKARLTTLKSTASPRVAKESTSASFRTANVTKSPYIPVRMGGSEQRGPRVVQIQRLLQRHGFRLHADGWFGPETVSAVKRFQRSHGLRADGIVGPATSVALHRSPRPVRTVRSVSHQQPRGTRDEVTAIQRALRRAGHRVAVDGYFGQETEVAVARFQRAHGLYPDGVVGPKTWRALTRVAR